MQTDQTTLQDVLLRERQCSRLELTTAQTNAASLLQTKLMLGEKPPAANDQRRGVEFSARCSLRNREGGSRHACLHYDGDVSAQRLASVMTCSALVPAWMNEEIASYLDQYQVSQLSRAASTHSCTGQHGSATGGGRAVDIACLRGAAAYGELTPCKADDQEEARRIAIVSKLMNTIVSRYRYKNGDAYLIKQSDDMMCAALGLNPGDARREALVTKVDSLICFLEESLSSKGEEQGQDNGRCSAGRKAPTDGGSIANLSLERSRAHPSRPDACVT
jgi:hypothetical protein